MLFQRNFGTKSINKVLKVSNTVEEFIENIQLLFAASDQVLVNNKAEVQGILDRCQKTGVTLINYFEESYPQLLREIPDSPLVLACKGSIGLLKSPCISVVGTRDCTHYGKQVTKELCEFLSTHSFTTVSGMAFGIDAEVHINSMQTIAVLPTFPSKAIPANNQRIYLDILNKNGLIISENIKDEEVAPYMYVSRNRIVAGLSKKTIIVEAGEKSGAVITANYALDYDREVFSVPGTIFSGTSTGCNNLISENVARILTKFTDLLELANSSEKNDIVESRNRDADLESLTEDEGRIYYALSDKAVGIDDLSKQTGILINVIGYTLINLELKGLVRKDILNNYERVK